MALIKMGLPLLLVSKLNSLLLANSQLWPFLPLPLKKHNHFSKLFLENIEF
jgi:hypothetical protein